MVGTRRDFITERVSRLPASPTIAVANEVNALLARGVDVVDFGPGEPDFDSPADATEAAIEALRSGRTHYAPSRGISELRTAIAGKLSRENGLRYDPEREIVVTPGAKQAVLEAVVVTVGSGDEVIIFEPAWGTYSAIVTLAGGTAVPVQLTDEFTIDPER
ncbi:MAG TPA: aminotransferase class I/II-fold pyridoxal phosphate-dependent enzyme, partial [Chloroflexota bacterium]|nr:aminotransferase class I/II-fold pyridoxal phosphate-dependent enzyme [Chloroflexota bacterium]